MSSSRAGGVLQRRECPGRIDFDHNSPVRRRHQIEDESLEFQGIWPLRLDPPAGGVQTGRFLAGDVKRQPVGHRRHAIQKRQVEHVDGDAAGPNGQRAVGVAPPRHVVGQVAIFYDHQPPVHLDDVANSLQRIALGDHLAGHLRAAEQVIAETLRPANLHQRIIDLEVEQLPHSAAPGFGQAASGGKRGQLRRRARRD